MLGQKLSRSSNREHLVAQESLEFQDNLDILCPVAPLPSIGSDRAQILGKLFFPVSQSMHLYACDLACEADTHALLLL